jgi:hypothetical protein
MDFMKDKLKEILNISEQMLNMMDNGFPLPGTKSYETYVSLLEKREVLIEDLRNCDAERDVSTEKTLLHKIEKIETQMLSLLRSESASLKAGIETIEKGKKAVKNGYLNNSGKYKAKNLFSKRG